jgi:hypothetical protein
MGDIRVVLKYVSMHVRFVYDTKRKSFESSIILARDETVVERVIFTWNAEKKINKEDNNSCQY